MRSPLVVFLSVAFLVRSVLAEQTYDSGYAPELPVPFPSEYRDYQILPDAASPDGQYAFIFPKRTRLYDLQREGTYGLFLAALKPFRILSRIPTGHSDLTGKNYYAAVWARDSSIAVFIAGMKCGPDKVSVLHLRAGKVAKQNDLTAAVRQQVLRDYKKSHVGRFNDYYEFVFEDRPRDTTHWKLDDTGHFIVIDTICTTDWSEMEPRRWAVRFKGKWDVATGRFTENSFTPIDERPNQAMQRTAGRSAF